MNNQFKSNNLGLILIISGPSTVGKSRVIRELRKINPELYRCISITTRKPRDDERKNYDYIFVSEESFDKEIRCGNLLQWIDTPLGRYGILSSPTLDLLKKGVSVVMDLNPTGMLQIKKQFQDVCSVFLLPPSLNELYDRLSTRGKARGIHSGQDVKVRYGLALEYINKADQYDYILINDNEKETAHIVMNIFEVEMLYRNRQEILKGYRLSNSEVGLNTV